MDKIEFIELAHAAQHDAGSMQCFTKQVIDIANILPSRNADPVAAFIACLIIGAQEEGPDYDFDYYYSELSRIFYALHQTK